MTTASVLFILSNFSILLVFGNSVWHYECSENYCRKELTTSNTTLSLSFAECNILCLDSAGLWPSPTGNVSIANLTEINADEFSFELPPNSSISYLISEAIETFDSQVRKLRPCKSFLTSKYLNVPSVNIVLEISDRNSDTLDIDTDESYTLNGFQIDSEIIRVTLKAVTYFGARNGLETLTQLIVFDDIRNRTLFPATITITDAPKYPWRGITLDTARNFITPKAIKRTLRAMAASKLNTLHWHMTDTASFPYVSKSKPELSQYGAYSPNMIYDDATVRSLVEYARVRGIRIVPELDAPAHIGEGWQTTGFLTCFNWQPWESYCAGPPCGQLDPSRPELYDYLEDIYGDILDQFGTEFFHMGGDEVNLNCWNNTDSLTTWMVEEKGWGLTTDDFWKAWIYFQKEAESRLYKKAEKNVSVILWSSDLTGLDNVESLLPPENYIIQVWTEGNDTSIQDLLNKNYSIILTNYDALYLDCGFASWVSTGNNWCSPYKGWQMIYDNKPTTIAGDKVKQVLGGEVALWTEEADSRSIDSRLWPRAAAFAETLWSEPSTDWSKAQERMLLHRERLVRLGIDADALQPEWCLRNQQYCPLNE